MKIDLDCQKLTRVLDMMVADGDAEKLSAEYAVDFFEAQPPMCMEIEFVKGVCHVLSAYELLFSDEMDGWYSGDRIEDPQLVASVLQKLIEE